MVLLNLRTDNNLNTTLAKFDTLFNESYIQFSNISNNYIFNSGISNNFFKIYNPNIPNDLGIKYNSNILNVKTIDAPFLLNNSYTYFPNDYTPISDYQFTEPSTTPITNFNINRSFDINDTSYWQSDNVYNPDNGIARDDINTYKFQDSYGHFVKIKFPYLIIPIGISVNSVSNPNDPLNFTIYASFDNITWDKIYSIDNNFNNTTLIFNNNNLYLYVTVVVTRINRNPLIASFQFFRIYELKIISKPIMNLDNYTKLTYNNIYNLNSIHTKKIVLNDYIINSIQELNASAVVASMNAFNSQYSIFWKNNGITAYMDSNIASNIAINKTFALSSIDIKGDISFINRNIINRIIVSTVNNSYSSSYIFIGTFNIKSIINKNFFKITLYIYDISKYYFQIINIYTYTYIEFNIATNQITSFKLYWDTVFDDSFAVQRIVDVVYTIDYVNYIINLYVKYNDVLDITYSQTISGIRDTFTNYIYIDESHTSTSGTDMIYISASNIQTLNNPNFLTAINIHTTNLNKNILYSSSNIITNLTTNNISLNNSLFKSGNILSTNNRFINDTGISASIFSNLTNFNNNSNKITCFDNNGILTSINVSSNLLSNVNYISTCNSFIPISSNGIYQPFFIHKNNISNLNILTNNPNSLVIIDNNSNYSTIPALNIGSFTTVLNLFNFNHPNSFGHTRINTNLNINELSVNNNLFVGLHTISSNRINQLLLNNKPIGTEIFKNQIKIPNLNDITISSNQISTGGIVFIKRYNVSLNTGINISLEINMIDDLFDDNKKVTNIFKRDSNLFWQTQNNFLDYRNQGNTFSSYKYIIDDTAFVTRCGAYIVFNINTPFVLTYYSILVNYTDIKNTMRDFNIFAYSSLNSSWNLIDSRTNIFLNNNMINNIFNIPKLNYDVYSRYAICIVSTHNNNFGNPNYCIINSIELGGYIPNSTNYNYSNYNIYTDTSPIIYGFNNIGISNINPIVPLSIGNDINNNSTESLINLNHPSFTNSIEKPIILFTRPSTIFSGIKASHYLNNWGDNNTTYTIKLSHGNTTNEQIALSMNSDGKIGIGTYPNTNDSFNGLSIYNSGLSFYDTSNKFINIRSGTINNSYNIVFPPSLGSINTSLCVSNINLFNKTIFLNWINTAELNATTAFTKFGDPNVIMRNENGIVVQIGGKSLIGYNVNTTAITSNILLNNSLIVSGSIYGTIYDTIIESNNPLLNLNYFTLSNLEKPLISISRPNSNFSNIKASHYLSTWNSSNTSYTIKLNHANSSNDSIILAMNSDGKIGIGTHPILNHSCNALSIFNSGISFYDTTNKFINIRSGTINNSYNIIFPPNVGLISNSLSISNIDISNKTIYLNWSNGGDTIFNNPFNKLGNQLIPSRDENGIAVQIAGKSLIGNDVSSNLFDSSYLSNYHLNIAGGIYASFNNPSTHDTSNNPLLFLNYSNSSHLEKPIIKLSKPSNDYPNITATHYISSWSSSNTNYSIKLLHNNDPLDERTILSLNSDGKIGIGTHPNSNHYNNALSIYNSGISLYDSNLNFINIRNPSSHDNYQLILPSDIGSYNQSLSISNIDFVDKNIYLSWSNGLESITSNYFNKFGDLSTPIRNENDIALQIAGKCLIGTDVSTNIFDSSYLSKYHLNIAGGIYSTFNDLGQEINEPILNLNHFTNFNNNSKPFIYLSRPSIFYPNIRVSHHISTWFSSNTNYSIKLTHDNDLNNDNTVLSLNSDGKIGIGGHPNPNHQNNAISIFNSGLSLYDTNDKFINIRNESIIDSYHLILPPDIGTQNYSLAISNIDNQSRKIYLNWTSGADAIIGSLFNKFGDPTVPTRNENGIAVQVAGKCLVGNNVDSSILNSSYLSKNHLIVSGSIYATNDINADSDISYKYNLEIIKKPLSKLKQINGYTFNRYDTNDNLRYSGLIAQEVQKILPEVITKKHDGKLRIIYSNLAGIFVESIKELDNKYYRLNIKLNISICLLSSTLLYLFLSKKN